jgi:predicted MPP superfamily phosphohydrolase
MNNDYHYEDGRVYTISSRELNDALDDEKKWRKAASAWMQTISTQHEIGYWDDNSTRIKYADALRNRLNALNKIKSLYAQTDLIAKSSMIDAKVTECKLILQYEEQTQKLISEKKGD